jgi:hypothetical protein
MSLEICEVKNPDQLKIKYSRLFIDRVLIIIKPEAELKFIKISDELYQKREKVYFPLFENIIFLKNPKYTQAVKIPIVFKGNFIQEDETGMIKSAIKKFDEKGKQNYEEYKKILDKDISELINSMNNEIINQKNFQKSEYLTKKQYNENINLLADSYIDILNIKIENDINLKKEDKTGIYKFYKNMIEGLKNNSLNTDILIDINKNSEVSDIN